MPYREALLQLKSALPSTEAMNEGDDLEIQTRAVLSWLVDTALSQDRALETGSLTAGPSQCPNCGGPAASLRSPYCGECCKEEAAFVRQLRGSIDEGTILDPERQAALGQKLWRILGGGMPRRVALVQGRTLERVIEKKGGRCETCGAPATRIDNVGSG